MTPIPRDTPTSETVRVPALRVVPVNTRALRPEAPYVLYWMIAQRRTRANFALQYAIEEARGLGLGLVVLEALRIGYPWASARMHRFVLDGMAVNQQRFARTPVFYFPYIEPTAGHGSGLLETLAQGAALVVTDEFPCFFLPRMVRAAAQKVDVRMVAVDSNGILPLRATPKAYTAAVHFRRFMQGELPAHLSAFPLDEPLARAAQLAPARLPAALLERWPPASEAVLSGRQDLVSALAIDQHVGPVPYDGGAEVAERGLADFIARGLGRYDERNQPEEDVVSGLSPYLHFGHISAHTIVQQVLAREGFQPAQLGPKPTASREGWWHLSPPAEGFLDQMITWRELGYGFCHHRPDDYDRYDSLPAWVLATFAKHAADPRPSLYDITQLDRAKTHDPLWNAAQNQLRREGRIHNYLRMLWGKKILEWSPSAEAALAVLIELNNRYSVDGRNPNSYSGIFWTLGRFDRPWAPERSIFGLVRYMSSDNTARKVRVKTYMRTYAHGPDGAGE